MLNQIRSFARNNLAIRKFIAYQLAPSGLFDKVISNMTIHPDFERRIKEVVACPDNAKIARVPNAGDIVNGKQIMHNGLKINVGSYYGPEVAQQLKINKGVHEPQEELVFSEVLKYMKPNSTMIELGAFWSFYSMWFHSAVPNAHNFMVEPDPFNISSGIKNFKLNNFKGDFTQAFVGDKMDFDSKPRMICVDGFCEEKKIDFVDILHSDIQGYEYDMLIGAQKMISQNKIGYIFISTHTNEVHNKCLNFLKERQFAILCSCDLDQTYADDGLIVAKAPQYIGVDNVPISLKPKQSKP